MDGDFTEMNEEQLLFLEKFRRSSEQKMNGRKKETLKILFIGSSGVGKTSLLHRYVENKFDQKYKTTIGADFLSKDFSYQNKLISLQIW